MNPVLVLLLGLFALSSYRSDAATCTASVTTGNWENASTWSCGHVPTCNDAIVIPSGSTVTITSILTYTSGCSSMSVTISGTLDFQTGKKLYLPSGSIINITSSGLIDPGNGGGNSNLIDIGSTTVWNAASGPVGGPRTLSDGTLPIELLGFRAESCTQGNCLYWSTATETNNAYFTVERAGDDFQFQNISTVIAAGNSNRQQDYNATDANPPHALLYYRLSQTDKDGNTHQAAIVAMDLSALPEPEMQILPNPNTGDFTLRLYSEKAESAIIQVYQNDGRICYTSSLQLEANAETLLNVSKDAGLKPGLYTIALCKAEHRVNLKMIVQ